MLKYVLHLYVTGQNPRSLRAEANLRRICQQHLGSSECEIVLVDVLQSPDKAEAANIFATPATVRIAPLPSYRVIGDLSEPRQVMTALGLEENEAIPAGKEA